MAEGEFKAAEKMTAAAKLYGEVPVAIKLRELQTYAEIAREKNMIIISSSSELGEVAAVSQAIAKKA